MGKQLELTLPQAAQTVVDVLEASGFPCYAVGGCVRDALLGLTPPDWDFTTAATPAQMRTVLRGFTVLPTGEKHGTVTVLSGGMPLEITTFRVDGAYRDARHPESVSFSTRLEDDLSRRDFTVNAMAWSRRTSLIDPFGGAEDLAAGILRCVGAPEKRFREDALRLLRGCRFASRLGLTPEEATAAAMEGCAPLLCAVSRERIYKEFCGILCGKGVQSVLLSFRPVMENACKELRAISAQDWQAAAARISAAPADPALRLALLLRTCAWREALASLKPDRAMRETVKLLCSVTAPPGREQQYALLRAGGRKCIGSLSAYLALCFGGEDQLAALAALPLCPSELAVSGKDLQSMGRSGRAIGLAQEKLLGLVLHGCPNTAEALIKVLESEDT